MTDGRGRYGVVTGDHAHLNTGAVALGYGVFGFGACGIDNAYHGQDGQVIY